MSLTGLVLAGGKSSRMNVNKNYICYHAQPQLDHTYNLLKNHLENVFVSVSPQYETDLPKIIDKMKSGGPLNGLMSAFKENQNTAWLIIANDMPLVEDKHIEILITKRNKSKLATCFLDDRGKPYPLFAIIEKTAFKPLESYIKSGNESILDFFNTHEIETTDLFDKIFLSNANTPDQADKLHSIIKRE